jgi:hypothetical protein
VDGIDGDLALLVAEHHGAQHDFLRQLLGLGLHHQHSGFGTRHHQIHLTVLAGGLAWVEHVFPVDITHARRADRAVERDTGDRQRAPTCDHGGDVGIHLGVERQGVNDHMHFVEEAFGEQRTDRTVDQAAGQGFEFAGLGFALEEAAGDLAGGVGLLDVVDGQREEILARLGALEATTVASTTVSSMLTSTAPVAWRAISPVSMVTVCWPHWKVLVTLLKMLMFNSPDETRARGRPGGPESDGLNTMPFQKKSLISCGMTQRGFVRSNSEVKSA